MANFFTDVLFVQLINGLFQHSAACLGARRIAGAERVEHRGDAGRRHLRVMADQCRQGWPAYRRSRLDLDFQIVGV